jgi:hypothetical protein
MRSGSTTRHQFADDQKMRGAGKSRNVNSQFPNVALKTEHDEQFEQEIATHFPSH